MFCFECILKWSEVTNQCPLCKARFEKLFRRSKTKSHPLPSLTNTTTINSNNINNSNSNNLPPAPPPAPSSSSSSSSSETSLVVRKPPPIIKYLNATEIKLRSFPVIDVVVVPDRTQPMVSIKQK